MGILSAERLRHMGREHIYKGEHVQIATEEEYVYITTSDITVNDPEGIWSIGILTEIALDYASAIAAVRERYNVPEVVD